MSEDIYFWLRTNNISAKIYVLGLDWSILVKILKKDKT